MINKSEAHALLSALVVKPGMFKDIEQVHDVLNAHTLTRAPMSSEVVREMNTFLTTLDEPGKYLRVRQYGSGWQTMLFFRKPSDADIAAVESED